jgi:hypothetical protein
MQINRKRKASLFGNPVVTVYEDLFGDPVATVYEACGKRRARGILPRAFQAHFLVFQNWVKEAGKILKLKTYKTRVDIYECNKAESNGSPPPGGPDIPAP